jgi:hypothetical protein
MKRYNKDNDNNDGDGGAMEEVEVEGSMLSDGGAEITMAEETADDLLFSREEARVVRRSKRLVYLVLVVMGIGVALLAYHSTNAKATNSFLYSVRTVNVFIIRRVGSSW